MSSTAFAFKNIKTSVFSCAIFLFGALALILSSGYTYGPLLLLIPALGYLFVRPYPSLSLQDKIIISALLIYFSVGVATNIYHHLPSREYDNVSRFLLAVPVLLLLLRFPLKPIFLWSGIAVGAIGGAIVAGIDFFVNGESRAGGHNNPIQFGDMAMLFACLLLAGFSWARLQSRVIVYLFIAGIASGIFASLLSGARGGWIALPIALAFFFFQNTFHADKRRTLLLILGLLFASLAFYFTQSFSFLQLRIQDAISDVYQYYYENNSNTSIGIRFTLWQSGLDLIAQRPFVGWGTLDNYIKLTGDQSDIFRQFSHFHNELLDAFVKRGLLGVLALLALYLLPGLAFYRQMKTDSVSVKAHAGAGLILVLATAVFGLTQSFFCHASGVMVYAFMLVILWAQTRALAAN